MARQAVQKLNFLHQLSSKFFYSWQDLSRRKARFIKKVVILEKIESCRVAPRKTCGTWLWLTRWGEGEKRKVESGKLKWRNREMREDTRKEE
jgi:hypothetical protein